MSTVAFSAAGSLLNSNIDDVVNTQTRVVAKVSVAAAESATITHFNDTDLIRSVRVLNGTTGADVTSATGSVTSITKSSSSGTAVVFAASGTYFVIIEN